VATGQSGAQGIPLDHIARQLSEGHLEEVVTTGLPPYQFEEFSDNRFRTELGPDVSLRMKY
jgi:hypothetical protein